MNQNWEKNCPNMDDCRWSKIIHFWNRTVQGGYLVPAELRNQSVSTYGSQLYAYMYSFSVQRELESIVATFDFIVHMFRHSACDLQYLIQFARLVEPDMNSCSEKYGFVTTACS